MQHLLHHQYLVEDLWRLHPNVTCVISFFGARTLSPTRVAIKKRSAIDLPPFRHQCRKLTS